MSGELRKRFLTAMGETYESYGYPSYCGWIEGLLLLEPDVWSQRKISGRLRELFPDSKYPTSITSVNRALKILEDYGVIEKAGSRKTGYRYQSLSSSGVIATMLERFVAVNEQFIDKLEALSAGGGKTDSELRRAISYQIGVAKEWSRLIGELVVSINKNS
jgi:DNA-binding transcriptional regulator GbsR (MarR family)